MKIKQDEVAKRLKELRTSKGLTLEEWSKLFGVNKSSVSRWEHGSIPHPKTLKKIAQVAKVGEVELLYGSLEDYVISYLTQTSTTKKMLEELPNLPLDIVDYLEVNNYSYKNDQEIIAYLSDVFAIDEAILRYKIGNVNRFRFAIEGETIYKDEILPKIDKLFSLVKDNESNTMTALVGFLDLLLEIEKEKGEPSNDLQQQA